MSLGDEVKPLAHNAPRIFMSEWLEAVPQVKLTPLHWLAYWNDYRTIQFLLSLVCCNDKFEMLKLLDKSERGLTAIDIAGMHRSDDAVITFLQFFEDNFATFAELFRSTGTDEYKASWTRFKPR